MRHYQLVPVRYNAQQLLTRCEPIMRAGCVSASALKEAGEGWSLSTNVCIAKAAARRIKEEPQS